MNELETKITFVKASVEHKEIIFSWLAEPHMMAFWDNSQEHKDDILNFICGRKQHYFSGTTQYYIGLVDGTLFCFLLADVLESSQDLSDAHKANLSREGHTIALDFGIGNKAYLGKGLASITLKAFVSYYHSVIDPKADTFFIDPDENNPRAIHVYAKAGFKLVGEYSPQEGAFVGSTSLLMIQLI